MELSKLQNDILNAPSNRSVVLASAASGKTRLMTEKVRQLLRANVDPRTVAVITFTNMAATELRQRLGDDYKDGLFVGTIHALANKFLLSAGIKTNKVIDEDNFDQLFEMVESHPLCIKHLDWILLDEGQDSDQLQFNFLFKMINPDYFFICADPKQSIYQWKGSRPSLVMNLAYSEGVQLFDMNENYRNGYNILAYAKNLIRPTGLQDTSIAMRGVNGTVAEVPFSADAVLSRINRNGDLKNTAILCRTNVEIGSVCGILGRNGIPYDTFKQSDLSKDELCAKMSQNTIKVLTVHGAKGLEWPQVFVLGMRYSTIEDRNIAYVAATRARDELIWMYYTPMKKTKKNNGPRVYNWQ